MKKYDSVTVHLDHCQHAVSSVLTAGFEIVRDIIWNVHS